VTCRRSAAAMKLPLRTMARKVRASSMSMGYPGGMGQPL
jgi:hypothetical protein